MTAKTKAEIKAFFEQGDRPTESQFIDLIDSYVDRSGPIGSLEAAASAGSQGFAFVSGQDCEVLGAAAARTFQGITVYTTALAIAAVAVPVSAYATTAQAVAGTSSGVAMDPVLTKNAINALGTSGLVLLGTATASNSAAIEFVNGTGGVVLDSTYSVYIITMSEVVAATDNVELYARHSTDAGSNYAATGYESCYAEATASTLALRTATIGIELSSAQGNSTSESLSGTITIYDPAGATKTKFTVNTTWQDTLGNQRCLNGGGYYNTAENTDALRLIFSSGNIASGEFKLYGLKKTV